MDEFRKKILTFLSRGESVTILAPSGYGKSRFGQSLGGLYLDTNLLPSTEELIKKVKSSNETKLIILDSIDKVLDDKYTPLFRYLKGLRDLNKYKLAFVFLSKIPISSQHASVLSDLYPIVTEHIESMPPLTPDEYDTFGHNLSAHEREEIAALSGGIPALVKTCIFAFRDKQPLDPKINPRLKAQLENIVQNYLDPAVYGHSTLITAYLLNKKSSELTVLETKLFDLLLTHKGQVVTKNQICEHVYPDVKNKAGISDHSLDQLVHRLRNKVSFEYRITTKKGFGYKLDSNPS